MFISSFFSVYARIMRQNKIKELLAYFLNLEMVTASDIDRGTEGKKF